MHDGEGGGQQRTPKKRGNLFLVDVPTYGAVCALGNADVAAAYLILAAGTGADNRTSTWSREAISNRTSLTWRKARECIDKLEAAGFVRWLTPKGSPRPRFDLPPIETRPRMQKHVKALANKLMAGGQPETATEKGTATIGQRDGWFTQGEDGAWQFVTTRRTINVYMPNSLVGDETGKATGQSTIIDRIRLARDPMALRLLVDLYAAQDLAELGGVDRGFLERRFKRESVSATAKLQVWQFGLDNTYVTWSDKTAHHKYKPTAEEQAKGYNQAHAFFQRAAILEDAGALEWAYYVAEDSEPGSTLIYPVAVVRHNKPVWSELETIVGGYATRAACGVCGKDNDPAFWESHMPNWFLLPTDRLAKQAALVGVPRLRYRAKTTNAARWRNELVKDAADTIDMFRGIINEHAPELLVEADRRLADFNAASMQASTSLQSGINVPSSHPTTGSVSFGNERRAAENW